MRLFVGLTERAWFDRLRALRPDDANLWRPHGRAFRALKPGDPFLFRLHAPWNAIVGSGRFIEARTLPLSLAWLAFGAANGVGDPDAFHRRVERVHPHGPRPDPPVSSVLLAAPTFLDEPDWVATPIDWRPSVAHGKVYEGDAARNLLASVSPAASTRDGSPTPADIGSGRFRLLVADAYGRRCAITGERNLAALDVTHIQPRARGGANRVENGLLLRADLAGLFRHGLLTVEPDGFVVRVNPRVRGAYAGLDGRSLQVVPERFDLQPSRTALATHGATFSARRA